VDPALIESRQQIFELTYGFSCTCPSCNFISTLGSIPSLPVSEAALQKLDNTLQKHCFLSSDIDDSTPFVGLTLPDLPENLHPVLRESYLSRLTDTFSRSSHEGSYHVALDVGLTVLAVYLLIYPKNYPQIGREFCIMENIIYSDTVNRYASARDGEDRVERCDCI
jgi:hypothetical protein